MAGLGFKDFSVETFTAADIDGYLMQQQVMVFADSAARGSALGTAIVSEGMHTYLKDTDSWEYYDGTDWVSR